MYVNKAYNELDVSVTLQRIDLCDILLALTFTAQHSDAQKWSVLHDKVRDLLHDFDDANFEAYRRANNAVV